jgi:hypothetical protein
MLQEKHNTDNVCLRLHQVLREVVGGPQRNAADCERQKTVAQSAQHVDWVVDLRVVLCCVCALRVGYMRVCVGAYVHATCVRACVRVNASVNVRMKVNETRKYLMQRSRFNRQSTVQYTVHSTQYTVHSTQYTAVHSTQYTAVHSTQYTVHSTQYTVQSAVHSTTCRVCSLYLPPPTLPSTTHITDAGYWRPVLHSGHRGGVCDICGRARSARRHAR